MTLRLINKLPFIVHIFLGTPIHYAITFATHLQIIPVWLLLFHKSSKSSNPFPAYFQLLAIWQIKVILEVLHKVQSLNITCNQEKITFSKFNRSSKWAGSQNRPQYFSYCLYFSRYAYKPPAHHGQASFGSVRALQSSHGSRGPRGGDQQEAMARDHQGSKPAKFHNFSCIHFKNTVRII